MSDILDSTYRWVSLPIATQWIIKPESLVRLIAAGTVRLGADPQDNIFLDRESLERSIVALAPEQAIAKLKSGKVIQHSTTLTLSEAAARVHMSPKTIRKAINSGHLVSQTRGINVRTGYKIAIDVLMAWYENIKPDTADVASVLNKLQPIHK